MSISRYYDSHNCQLSTKPRFPLGISKIGDPASDITIFYFSSHHSFSLRTCSSSSGVKSFLMLNVFLISSGDFPLIMFATVLQLTSKRPLMSR